MKVRDYWDSFKDTINEGSRKFRKAYKTSKAKRSAKKKINKALEEIGEIFDHVKQWWKY